MPLPGYNGWIVVLFFGKTMKSTILLHWNGRWNTLLDSSFCGSGTTA